MEFSVNWFKNRYLWAYLAAILFHLLLFFLQAPIQRALLVPATPPKAPDSPPLAFEFVDVPDVPPSEKAPEKTPLLADRNLVSRDNQTEALPESPLPSSKGVTKAKEDFKTVAGQNQPQPPSPSAVAKKSTNAAAKPTESADDQGFNFAEVLRQNPEETRQQKEEAVFGRPLVPKQSVAMDNANSRALERGGLQLSTYAWNFAPYMAYLKRQINAHIFPPSAFELGIIDGTTRVKFRILRDGTLEGPDVLGFKGSPLLRDTSVKAIELSAKFKPLPKDFPDAYLEIIGTFEYIILR